jgi:hypothetical protein
MLFTWNSDVIHLEFRCYSHRIDYVTQDLNDEITCESTVVQKSTAQQSGVQNSTIHLSAVQDSIVAR